MTVQQIIANAFNLQRYFAVFGLLSIVLISAVSAYMLFLYGRSGLQFGGAAAKLLRRYHWSGELNLEQLEFQAINKALNDTGWNISHAARLLGISRDTLRYRLDKHQLG